MKAKKTLRTTNIKRHHCIDIHSKIMLTTLHGLCTADVTDSSHMQRATKSQKSFGIKKLGSDNGKHTLIQLKMPVMLIHLDL